MMSHLTQNFFELQRHYKRNSLILYFLFVMAMMVHVLIALLVCLLIWRWVFGDLTGMAWFWVVLIIPSYFALTILYQYNKITHNHELLFKGIEVKRLFINVSGINPSRHDGVICVNDQREFDPKYRRYYEFAEQLAIASNLTLPKLYVMDDKGINAFVAGFDKSDTMLVVSEGALMLDNDSLYGLIGHEYGHILHGDARLNVNMYVLMSGLSWLYDVADGLEWASQWQQTPKVNRYYVKDEHGHRREYVSVTGIGRLPIEFVSLLIRLVGFLGMASSEWIKQHFNHQREFLADATAVQLTRSDGVMRLLDTLQKNPYLTKNKKAYTTHLSYFFFLNPHDNHHSTWRERISHMAETHPSTRERIGALKTGDYEAFAKMAVRHLDTETLQQTHDEMMAFHLDLTIATMDYRHQPPHEVVADDPANVLTHHQSMVFLNDKVVNGGLPTDESWKQSSPSDCLVYPTRAKADPELVGVPHVHVQHVSKMHLPLIVHRYLHNDKPIHQLSLLFALYYAVMFCHDSHVININDGIDVGALLLTHQPFVVCVEAQLLKAVALMDRRIDNALLLIMGQRIAQDLSDTEKRTWLMADYHSLIEVMRQPSTQRTSLAMLWRGVHLSGLLALFEGGGALMMALPCEEGLGAICAKYPLSSNDWVVILLLMYIVISHEHTQPVPSLYRHIRLINHTVDIEEQDMTALMDMVGRFGVIELAVWLQRYRADNPMISKRHIDTLHTALLGNGAFDEQDYEILLALSHRWRPNQAFVP